MINDNVNTVGDHITQSATKPWRLQRMFIFLLISEYLISSYIGKYSRYPTRWGAWVAQLVGHPTSAQVMISWFVGLEPASDSESPSLATLLLLTLCLSVSFSKINIKLFLKITLWWNMWELKGFLCYRREIKLSKSHCGSVCIIFCKFLCNIIL